MRSHIRYGTQKNNLKKVVWALKKEFVDVVPRVMLVFMSHSSNVNDTFIWGITKVFGGVCFVLMDAHQAWHINEWLSLAGFVCVGRQVSSLAPRYSWWLRQVVKSFCWLMFCFRPFVFLLFFGLMIMMNLGTRIVGRLCSLVRNYGAFNFFFIVKLTRSTCVIYWVSRAAISLLDIRVISMKTVWLKINIFCHCHMRV